MTELSADPTPNSRSAGVRISVAIGVALAFCLGVYILLERTRPDSGLVSFSFLLILPAAISAFIAYVADPWGERPLGAYLRIPLLLAVVVVAAALAILHEGVICILILSPLWLASGLAGAALTYRLRHRSKNGTAYCVSLLLLPLVAIELEPYCPLPSADVSVVRSIVIDASPERIWPLLRGIPDVHPGEGAWNVSQDVIGIPRPIGAKLIGEGIGADRFANWGQDIKFRERITDWQIGRSIRWSFLFDNITGWRFTDRHLMPDSPYFRVTTGGYSLQPIDATHTRVTLDTHYWIKTPVNTYSALWGELFLGDLENNLLGLVKHRAESASPKPA